jgi:hypothetical protein
MALQASAVRARLVALAGLVALAAAAAPSRAQLPVAVAKSSGQTVTPAFEGWYRNPDGTFSISFGYYNRNAEEVVSVPIGAANRVEPGPPNQGQPTEFQPGRHWGVFAVKVPADFGSKEVTWTIAIRGATYAIPGYLRANWQIDALEGEAGSGNTPPALAFDADGPEGRGPLGITGGPVSASAGVPVALSVRARDDGKAAGSVGSAGRGAVPVTLTWFAHQCPATLAGPCAVTFSPPSARVEVSGGQAATQATFTAPGDYIVRVRANDASGVAGAGHAQCCWTNGFIKVAVK